MSVYAHTPRGASAPSPEPLADHLAAVGAAAEAFGAAFGWGAVASLAGRLHDIGKCSAEFQAYLLGKGSSGGDHSGAGAIESLKLGLGPQVGHPLAAVIAGHHAGLADGTDLIERLGRPVPAYPGWRAHSGPLPSPIRSRGVVGNCLPLGTTVSSTIVILGGEALSWRKKN